MAATYKIILTLFCIFYLLSTVYVDNRNTNTSVAANAPSAELEHRNHYLP